MTDSLDDLRAKIADSGCAHVGCLKPRSVWDHCKEHAGPIEYQLAFMESTGLLASSPPCQEDPESCRFANNPSFPDHVCSSSDGGPRRFGGACFASAAADLARKIVNGEPLP